MSLLEGFLLVGAGVFAGFANTVAGGGSLLTLPLLIFMGLPSAEANASNRVAIFLQNIFSVAGFKSKGVSVFPFAIWLAISASAGAFLGSRIAVDIQDQVFNRILAVVMLVVIGLMVFKPKAKQRVEEMISQPNTWLSVFIFFFIGIYGGFIQAGVGFLIIATLTGVHGFNMAKTNSIKVFIVLCYTVIALAIFWMEGKIKWEYGLVLAIGNSAGGWIGSRWSVGQSDKLIKKILVVMVLGLSIKLWFF
ncbi:MAG: sulfite exporter TauE/SafE family protein [Cyclobacteriaceae bacterium]